MGFQTTWSVYPAAGARGRLVQGFDDHLCFGMKAAIALPWGRGVIQSKGLGADDDDDEVSLPINFPAADADAVIAGGASTAGIQNYVADGAAALDLDGAPVGAGRCSYGRPMQATLNAHSDWDATTMELWGFNTRGQPVYDTITIPADAGGLLLANNEVAFAQVVRCKVPAQTGTNGTFTLGFQGATAEQQEIELFGVVVLVDAGTESTTEYAAQTMATIMRRGRIWVTVENAVTRGQIAYLRHTSDGGSNTSLGTWRGNRDAGRAAAVLNARFATAASAAGLAQLEVF